MAKKMPELVAFHALNYIQANSKKEARLPSMSDLLEWYEAEAAVETDVVINARLAAMAQEG